MEDISRDIEETKSAEELGILVLDGSGSMANEERPSLTKAQAVRDAIAKPSKPSEGLFSVLKYSSRANEISMATFVFDSWVEERIPQTRIGDLDLDTAYMTLDLLQGHGDRTDIAKALTEAGRAALQFVAAAPADIPHYATVLLMSDGEHNVPTQDKTPVINAANEIRAQATLQGQRPTVVLACAPYGQDADAQTLQAIATPGFYQKCNSASELRAFFIASMASTPVEE